MIETLVVAVLGSGGVAGVFFAVIRHYIEKRLSEAEAREAQRMQWKIEQKKADD